MERFSLISLRKGAGSDPALITYIIVSLVIFPVSIYFAYRGKGRSEIVGRFVAIAYLLLLTVVAGVTLQQIYGNGANVLLFVLILFVMFILILPKQSDLRPVKVTTGAYKDFSMNQKEDKGGTCPSKK